MGCHALLQGIFPTQGLNPSLLSPMSPSLAGGFFTTEPPGQSTLLWGRNRSEHSICKPRGTESISFEKHTFKLEATVEVRMASQVQPAGRLTWLGVVGSCSHGQEQDPAKEERDPAQTHRETPALKFSECDLRTLGFPRPFQRFARQSHFQIQIQKPNSKPSPKPGHKMQCSLLEADTSQCKQRGI